MKHDRTTENRAHINDTISPDQNIFRQEEKYFRLKYDKKKNIIPIDLSEVIDFSNIENNTLENQQKLIRIEIENHVDSEYFSNIENVYSLAGYPGFYFMPNVFNIEQQKDWIKKCVMEFPVGNPNNLTNLEENREIWDAVKFEEMENLRWVSLGYHFQWTPRIYDRDINGEFPSDLNQMVVDLAKYVNKEMVGEAAIVNYYPNSKCHMGGHVDDAEIDMTKPIVSCSLGNTVVFLIGGTTRTEKPTAVFIRSGDVVILADHARYCYHAVPRMFEGTCPPELLQPTDDPSWQTCQNYIQDARINLNCRQVYPNKKQSPE